MSSATTTVEESRLRPGEVARIWLRHLTSLFIPVATLVFLWTGPHAWYVAPLFMAPFVLAYLLDTRPHTERRQPPASLPAWPFDALVYGLVALQFLIVFETARFFSVQGVFSVDMAMVILVVGSASGFSIITAHELIHRKKNWEQQLGRLLLCTVLYEHFYTEHLRGHHTRVGMPEDPATARFGESYEAFFRRTVPAQFRSAWQLEARRLGDTGMRLLDRRMLRSRILHGIAVGAGIAVAVLWAFGPAALFAFLLQAWTAVRLLESVNYFEHWGLLRRGARIAPADSWDTHSWFTYYGLTGLSRHASHHDKPALPFQQLRVCEEAPLLPCGYVGSVDMVMAKNKDFQHAATLELARCGLGPFPEAEPDAERALARLEVAHREEAALRPPRTGLRAAIGEAWGTLPVFARRALLLGVALVVTTAGVQWETAGQEMGGAARLALHAWIFASFGAAIPLRRWLAEGVGGESLSWAVGFALIVGLGLLSDTLW